MSSEAIELVERLRPDMARVQRNGRELPWEMQSGCSYRRIGTRLGGDGNVLAATRQASDGHLDLTMPEDQLDALVRLVNAIPEMADTIERLIAEREKLVGALKTIRDYPQPTPLAPFSREVRMARVAAEALSQLGGDA